MDENTIAEQLKQRVEHSGDTPHDPATPPPINTDNGQATGATNYQLDEITQYKLHDYFGEQYKASDEVSRQQLEYIYEEVSKMIPDKDYGFVIAKIRDLERIIGTAHSDDRKYKLYQWLKLNNMRRNIDVEMGAITNA